MPRRYGKVRTASATPATADRSLRRESHTATSSASTRSTTRPNSPRAPRAPSSTAAFRGTSSPKGPSPARMAVEAEALRWDAIHHVREGKHGHVHWNRPLPSAWRRSAEEASSWPHAEAGDVRAEAAYDD